MSEIKNVVALDIETCPVAIGNIPVDNIKYLLEKSKSKRTQKIIDVEKIDDEKGKVVVGPGSIGMPELNRVVCVCTYDGEGYDIAYWVDLDLIDEKTIILLDVFEDEHEQVCRWDDEGEMLSHVLDIIKFNQKIVTFNGNSFDLKYIALRSLLNGIRKIPVPLPSPTKRQFLMRKPVREGTVSSVRATYTFPWLSTPWLRHVWMSSSAHAPHSPLALSLRSSSRAVAADGRCVQ